MGVYLEDHPPARSQFRSTRRATVSGAIVVHTAENATDLVLPDGGAEAVASFISRRTDVAGSYHSVVDSDSIVRVGRYEWEMFGEGTGGNRWALHLSFACRASQWATLPESWFVGALRNGAAEAASMARWVAATVGVAVPARRITAARYRALEPGFVGHGDLDPGRRSDPGADFPWDEFLGLYAAEMSTSSPSVPNPGSAMEPAGSIRFHQVMADIDELYRAYRGARPSLAERRTWGADLAEKMFAQGRDPQSTLAFIEFALRQEAAQA
ncbi:MAG: hypothetical protein ACFCVK_24660 [Acidimicrobiales bacterium]